MTNPDIIPNTEHSAKSETLSPKLTTPVKGKSLIEHRQNDVASLKKVQEIMKEVQQVTKRNIVIDDMLIVNTLFCMQHDVDMDAWTAMCIDAVTNRNSYTITKFLNELFLKVAKEEHMEFIAEKIQEDIDIMATNNTTTRSTGRISAPYDVQRTARMDAFIAISMGTKFTYFNFEDLDHLINILETMDIASAAIAENLDTSQ